MGFMWRKFLNQGTLLQLFGISIPLLVYYQCTSPADNTICRVFAENAAYFMLFFFVSGFVALTLKKSNFMLFSWICTIMLCQFLKGNTEGSFYYTKVQDKENSISVAHFKMRKLADDSLLLNKVKAMKVDLVSISFVSELKSYIKSEIVQEYPYSIDLGVSQNGEHNFLYSKYNISYFKNIRGDNMNCLSGQIILDSIEGKKISILCFSIGDNIADNPKALMKSLVSISDLKKTSKVSEPHMVLGNVASCAWEIELKTFRSKILVNDSRLDLDLEKSGRHIFFSNQMRCVRYESYENGIIGTYEIRKSRKSQKQRDFISAR
jgi:hypothetical protein